VSIRSELSDGVATVTLCDPRGRNALDVESSRLLADALSSAAADPAARVILLRAEGRAFCVGGAIDFFERAGDALHDDILEIGEAINVIIRLLHQGPKITIAAAHGAVAGGGVGLLAAADVVLAARGTVLTLGYELLATSPDAGASWFLPRDIGYRRALALYLSSERISAERALELGLVTELVADDELDSTARELAARIAKGSPVAHAAAKRLFRGAASTPLERHLEDEIRAFADNTRRPEFADGVAAFLEKRSARADGAGS
jgi:2-(1,2-epoxy-1,2-dihydrophenyl)acetyl-CoA isomerase